MNNKYIKNEIKILYFIFLGLSLCTGGLREIEKVEDSVSIYAEIKIDSTEDGENIPGRIFPYLGPISIDFDQKGNIYIRTLAGPIQKYNTSGKRLWNLENKNTKDRIHDINIYEERLYSFNGKQIFMHNLETGYILDTFNLKMRKKDYPISIGSSRFYDRYLFVNRSTGPGSIENAHIFDLKKKVLSKRMPPRTNIFPVDNCPSCSFEFLESLFDGNTDMQFISQSEKYIVYNNNDSLDFVCIYNKHTGETERMDLSCLKRISISTNRFALIYKEEYLIVTKLVRDKKGIWYIAIQFYMIPISI